MEEVSNSTQVPWILVRRLPSSAAPDSFSLAPKGQVINELNILPLTAFHPQFVNRK